MCFDLNHLHCKMQPVLVHIHLFTLIEDIFDKVGKSRTWAFKFQVSSFKCPSLNHLHCQVLLLLLHSCTIWNTLEVQTLTFSKPFTNYISNMQCLLELSRKQILIHPSLVSKSKNPKTQENIQSIGWFPAWNFEKSGFARLLLFSRHLDAETLRLGNVLSGKYVEYTRTHICFSAYLYNLKMAYNTKCWLSSGSENRKHFLDDYQTYSIEDRAFLGFETSRLLVWTEQLLIYLWKS